MCDKEYHFSKFYWEHRSKCFKTSAETATQLPLPGPSRTSLMGDRPWVQGPATHCSFLGAHKAQGLDYRGVLQSGVMCLSFQSISDVWIKGLHISQHPIIGSQYTVRESTIHLKKTIQNITNLFNLPPWHSVPKMSNVVELNPEKGGVPRKGHRHPVVGQGYQKKPHHLLILLARPPSMCPPLSKKKNYRLLALSHHQQKCFQRGTRTLCTVGLNSAIFLCKQGVAD